MIAGSSERPVSEPVRYLHGTVRARPPGETFEIAKQYGAQRGVTRIADVTGLDRIGIPVWQAVRPMSRNLSVSQGKGLTHQAAKVSALMESIEMSLAEDPPIFDRFCIADASAHLSYNLREFAHFDKNMEHSLGYDWCQAHDIINSIYTIVPTDLIKLNFTRGNVRYPLFRPTSTGLASGNTRFEAMLHGFYEIIERDALAELEKNSNAAILLDPERIENEEIYLLWKCILRAQLSLKIFLLPSLFGVPVVKALIEDKFYCSFSGSGSHRDVIIAATRAITEAAQSRLTFIAGSRDDILSESYAGLHKVRMRSFVKGNELERGDWPQRQPTSGFLDQDFHWLVEKFRMLGRGMIVVDLVPSGFELAVVFCLSPGAKVPIQHG